MHSNLTPRRKTAMRAALVQTRLQRRPAPKVSPVNFSGCCSNCSAQQLVQHRPDIVEHQGLCLGTRVNAVCLKQLRCIDRIGYTF